MADTSILSWLGRASMCGDVDIERSAEMLKNYYQGIGPEPEYQEVGQSNDRQMTVKQDSDGWPGEIYLQAGDDPLSHFSEYDEVSWCDHPQGESDVRYVRADEPIAALASRPAELDDWISVEDRLPGKERCLAAYVNAMGKHRIIRAMYAGQFQIDAGEDAIDQGNCEYNEADDTFYLKAGWLECIDNWDDYSSIYVTEGTVTHWRRLPAAPSHTTNKEK